MNQSSQVIIAATSNGPTRICSTHQRTMAVYGSQQLLKDQSTSLQQQSWPDQIPGTASGYQAKMSQYTKDLNVGSSNQLAYQLLDLDLSIFTKLTLSASNTSLARFPFLAEERSLWKEQV